MSDARRWFPPLDPPPGGRARLVAAIADTRAGDRDLTPRQAAFACIVLALTGSVPAVARAVLRPDPIVTAIATAAPLPGRDGSLAMPSAEPGVQVYLVVATEPTR